MCKRLWCVYVLSKKQDVNLFVVDGRRHGPLLSKAKGDPASLLVQHIHQCAKMLARGHAAGAALCVVCHPWDMEKVGKAMQEDDLHLHHDFFYGTITFDQNPNSFQQVCCFQDVPCLFTV